MDDDEKTTITALKAAMQKFVSERNWEAFHVPKNLSLSIAIEAAEIMELYQWLTPEEALDVSLNDPEFREKVSDEIADVFLYLISLANVLGIDMSQSVTKKLAKNRLKYPKGQTSTTWKSGQKVR